MRTDRLKAENLRKAGYSYGMIAEELSIPKSTLSAWLRDIPFTPSDEVIRRIKTGRGRHGLDKQRMRREEIQALKEIGAEEVGEVSQRDLWMIGIGIWIGEGSKTIEQVRLVNSDSRLISVYMRWLREICLLDDENITVAMHLYPDLSEKECRRYWQGVTGLPEKQFRKTQVDRRLNKSSIKSGKLLHGTLHITVVSNGDRDRGVRLHRRIMGWVDAIYTSK